VARFVKSDRRPVAISVKFRSFDSWQDLKQRVSDYAAVGVTGVVVSDHLFTDRRQPGGAADRHDGPIVLGALAATFPDLHLSLLVANVGLQHPYFVIRHFAELAHLFGGRRFTLGLGAGWNREEFACLGLEMPSHEKRIQRLESSCALARELLASGFADGGLSNEVLRYDKLPLVPFPRPAPALAVGGGSSRALAVAARFADVVDFDAAHPWSSQTYGAVPDGKTIDMLRRLRTTDDHILDMQSAVRRARQESDSAVHNQEYSININSIRFGAAEAVYGRLRDDLRQRLSISIAPDELPDSLDRCPFVLMGSVEQMGSALLDRIELLNLDRVVLPDEADTLRLLRELDLPRSRQP
jgi:alkanesulfonate monooxygenase SsuD/methylene tetrahydromethanopterin reductase-like flavin-dependent oxidoreductase (luciferase family)